MSWKKTLLICLIILAAGTGLTTLIFSTEPTASQTAATQETAMLVDVINVQQGSYRPIIQAMGIVQPAQDITLSPRVSGEIIERSEQFAPGGYVQKGDTLLQIDPEDYRTALKQRRSELRQAESELTLEMGRHEAAKKEYQAYGDTLSEENKALVLREPQLESAKSSVESAQAAVEQAQLDLRRTTITAPFDAHILSRNVNVGSQVAPGNELGRLVGLDEYWIEATVPVSKLHWIDFPENDSEAASEVSIRNRTGWPEGVRRSGYLYKMIGALEDQTRLARILISVPDPHTREMDNPDKPRLMIGSFVETHIQAHELEDVVRLNRDYLRDNETVWVMENEELDIRDVNIVFQDAEYAYIDSGLQQNDKVVITNLSTVADGAPLRLEETSEIEQDTVTKEIQ